MYNVDDMELQKPLQTLKVADGMTATVDGVRVTVTAGKNQLVFEVRVTGVTEKKATLSKSVLTVPLLLQAACADDAKQWHECLVSTATAGDA